MRNFKQLVLAKCRMLNGITIEEFEEGYLKSYMGVRVKFAEEVKLPNGISHILFYVHRDDVAKFSSYVGSRYGGTNYYWREEYPKVWAKLPKEITDKYKPIW